MKKIDEIRFILTKNKQAKRAIVLVCSAILMLVGIFTTMKMLDEKERVSAHPTNPITIRDEDGNNPFDVPIDGGAVFESILTAQSPKFDNYLQNDDIVPILEKKVVDGTGATVESGSAVGVDIRSIERTTYGNYVVLYGCSGSGRGGLIKLAVFNTEGVLLAEDLVGEVTGFNLRVNTGFYNMSNNRFLVGTQNGSFFRYEISGESDTAATINRVSLTVPNDPNTNIKANLHLKVNTFSTYSDNSMIVGRINTTRSEHEGAVKHRIPFSTVNVAGWSISGFSGASSYLFSVENLLHTDPEINLPNVGSEVSTAPTSTFYNSDGKLYGTFYNSFYDGTTVTAKSSFQIFDTNEDTQDPFTGKKLKKRKYSFVTNSTMLVLEEICTNDYVYFLVLNPGDTELIRVNLNTYTSETIKTFPNGTRIKLIDNNDGTISYFGSTTSLTGAFYSDYYTNNLTGTNFFVSGLMKDLTNANPLETISVRALETNGYVYPTRIVDSGNNQLFMGGTTMDKDKFVDNLRLYSSATIPPTSNGEPSASMAFIGVLEINDDYSPIIKAEGNIDIDVSSASVANPSTTNYLNWNTLDRWLITGKEGGLVSDNGAVKVYDQMDSNDISLGSTPQDRERALQMNINRNPLAVDSAIDWASLGFNKTKSGAQKVTYFVTDSQGQTSVTSRWVNQKTNQTIEKADYCLDAQNFHIPLSGLDSAIPNDATFKRLAKTMAWNKTSGNIDEDGTDAAKLSNKVTIGAVQLQALRDATVAKPYPVDVTYKPESGVEVTNRVWVFVTTKNTIPNSETNPVVTPKDTNGVVYYADDYSIPFRLRGTQDRDEVLTRGNVKVYDYFDSTHETATELPTLADSGKNSNKLIVDFSPIQNALDPGVITPSVSYTWDGSTDGNHKFGTTTIGYLDVTLTGHTLWHVRQVVLDSSAEIVVPSKSYFDIQNILDNSGSPEIDPNYRANLTGESGKLADNPAFTEVSIPTDHLQSINDQVQLSLVIPEFYHYLGYHCTTQQSDPQGTSHQGNTSYTSGNPKLTKSTLNNDGEFWITLYIEPNTDGTGTTKTPQPYSWDYKKNDLGKIKTK
ncbi:hypothetical protein [Candidatus Enterococcus ferrettii]|uniref:Uncharacterized protein n=1 Tax=Candidatus Enterococcus ferrettii TaxID=2815324 RepID=A0ABV0EVH9_9ENTE|nr:hypothetical protein [Enterococcus sp. 665A]MBO1343069.1 hypothetical protein [Enterococcus sp. 665A]